MTTIEAAVRQMATQRPGTGAWRTDLVLLGALMAFGLAISWVGYYGADDSSYLAAMLAWANDPPFLGTDHWSLRHALIFPGAAVFAAFGPSEVGGAIMPLISVIGSVVIVYFWIGAVFDRLAALVAAILIATMPLLTVDATRATPDPVEAFFVLLACFLFFRAGRAVRQVPWLIGAGLAFGLAWLTRETMVFALLAMGVLFLAGFRVPRAKYFIMAGAFLAIVGAEFGIYAAATGEPLYRINIAATTHLRAEPDVGGVASRITSKLGSNETARADGLTRLGNISLDSPLDPLLVVLINQEFGLLFWAVLPALVISLFYLRRMTAEQKSLTAFLLTMGGIWFLMVSLQLVVSLGPRYFTVSSLFLVPFIAIAFFYFLRDKIPRLALLGLLGLIVTNWLGAYVDNDNPVHGQRVLTRLLQADEYSDTVIYSDPRTARYAWFLMETQGVQEARAKGEPPPRASLFLHNPAYVDPAYAPSWPRDYPPREAFQPQDHWERIAIYSESEMFTGVIIDAFGLKNALPFGIYRRLTQPNPPVTLYRVPAPVP